MGTKWQRAKRRQQGLGTWRLVRYADDFVIMVNGTRARAEALREEAAAVLAPMGLRLAEEKTRVVHIDEGFDFLSFTIRRMRKRGTSKQYVYTFPSRKAIQAIKDKISAKTYRSTRNLDPDVLIQSINRTLAGFSGGELPPPRSLQGRVQRDRPSCMGPDHALAKAEIQTRELPPRNASTAPPLLRARDLAVRSQRSQVHRRVSRAGHPLPLPRQQHTGPVGTPAGPGNQLTPAGKTRGAPGAVRVARRVRRAGRGNPPGAILAGRPGPTQLCAAGPLGQRAGGRLRTGGLARGSKTSCRDCPSASRPSGCSCRHCRNDVT